MSTEPAQPDTGADIAEMTLAELEAELRSYEPGTAKGEAHRDRRARLWARLDELSGVRKPAAATPTQRGDRQ